MSHTFHFAQVVKQLVSQLPWGTSSGFCRGFNKPIGVAEWETRIVDRLPEELRGSLPTVEEIEAELAREGKAK